MTRSRWARCQAWFSAQRLKRFAFWNIWFWGANQVLINVWRVSDVHSYNEYAVHYLNNISVAALWLASLSWWQSTRVEVKQDEG